MSGASGGTDMSRQKLQLVVIVCAVSALFTGCAARREAQPAATTAVGADPDPWPRQIQLGNGAATVYQPQVESWQGNQLQFRAAVGVRASGSSDETFGVVWGTAR